MRSSPIAQTRGWGTRVGRATRCIRCGAPAAYRQRSVEELSAVSGFTLTKRSDPRDALQNSDDIGAISAQMALLAHALIKIAQDLRLLASGPRGGFGEIRLPHVQQGSS